MQAIILAAGLGTRLRPFTETLPKCLVPVAGRALLERHLFVLKSCLIDPITIVGGYKAEFLKGKASLLRVNPEFATTNMVWTLRYAFDILSQGAILAYGDIAYSSKVLEVLLESHGDICVVVDRLWKSYWQERFASPLDDAETLRIGENGALVEIGKKPTNIDEIEGQYIGLMKFSAEGGMRFCEVVNTALYANTLINGKPVEKAYMTDVLQHLIGLGEVIKPVWIDGNWIEIDSKADVLVAESRVNFFRF